MSIPFENGNTKVIMLILTHSCNLKCAYCYERQRWDASKVMKPETAKKIIKEEMKSSLGGYNRLVIHFMGGEPLLCFNVIKEICEWIGSKDWPIEILLSATTNGTLLSIHKEWLWKHRNIFKIVLSADGNQFMQDKNRSNSFSLIDFEFYTSAWPDGKVKMTISPYTVGNVADGVIFLHQKGVKRIEGNLALGPSITWGEGHLHKYRQELRKLIRFYLDSPNVLPASMLNVDVCKIVKPYEWRKRCSCGEDLICFDTDGQAYPCHLFSPVTLDERQLKQFQSENIDFSDKESFSEEKCSRCAIRRSCPRCYGMNYLYTGAIASVPDVFCRASQIEFLSTCSLLYHRLKLHQPITNLAETEYALKYIKQIITNKNNAL